MTLLGHGIDLVEVERLAALVEKYGERFLRRVFTEREIATCAGRPEKLAARFAAKEAAAKAFGTGIGEAMAFVDLEIINAPSGQPELHWHGAAARTAAAHGVTKAQLSLTHTHSHAMASVILLG